MAQKGEEEEEERERERERDCFHSTYYVPFCSPNPCIKDHLCMARKQSVVLKFTKCQQL
jgi:hypothetical protein